MSVQFDNLFSIKGKIALVTGGSRGIGEMIAAGFLAHGAKVYISSRKAEVCAATAKRLSETYGAECIALPADLSRLAGVESLAQRLSGHPAGHRRSCHLPLLARRRIRSRSDYRLRRRHGRHVLIPSLDLRRNCLCGHAAAARPNDPNR